MDSRTALTRHRILSDRQQALLAEERRLLAELGAVLARLDVDAEDQDTFRRSLRQLDELFLLVVVGEFNAGKSAFINALLGQRVLEEGVTPTTSRIGLIKHGPAVHREATESGLDVITAPMEMLREINIVDTPGTNAVLREHEALTREFVPRSDLVLFITSADRPFTESERAFLQSIREWGKKVIVVVNKVDILEKEEDVRQVVSFVSENFRSLLGVTPEVFPVAARLALRAKTGQDGPEAMAKSRFEPLESYVAGTLDEEERVRLKLRTRWGWGCTCWSSTSSAPRRAWSCCARTWRRSRASTASSRSTGRTSRATSASGSPTWRRCCWSSSGAAWSSSTRCCAWGACSTWSARASSSAPSSARWWPTCPSSWRSGWRRSSTGWCRATCASGRA
jgi:small GTP-binding protein